MKLVALDLIGAVCKGMQSFTKKGILTHALQLLLDVAKVPKGLQALKDSKVDVVIKETMATNADDAVLNHLGNQLLEKFK